MRRGDGVTVMSKEIVKQVSIAHIISIHSSALQRYTGL